eukprot:m.319178 g.319178  ORF g.319178 m.319178 type:complete len:282 (-) comp16445_c0_seq80:217-1062(-)
MTVRDWQTVHPTAPVERHTSPGLDDANESEHHPTSEPQLPEADTIALLPPTSAAWTSAVKEKVERIAGYGYLGWFVGAITILFSGVLVASLAFTVQVTKGDDVETVIITLCVIPACVLAVGIGILCTQPWRSADWRRRRQSAIALFAEMNSRCVVVPTTVRGVRTWQDDSDNEDDDSISATLQTDRAMATDPKCVSAENGWALRPPFHMRPAPPPIPLSGLWEFKTVDRGKEKAEMDVLRALYAVGTAHRVLIHPGHHHPELFLSLDRHKEVVVHPDSYSI